MGMEIIFIALLVLLMFGGKRMPEVLRELGKASREFKRVREELTDAVTRGMDEHEVTPKPGLPAAAPGTENTADTMHEGEIPPEYAEYATLSPETTDAPPAAQEPDAAEAQRLSDESSATVSCHGRGNPHGKTAGEAPTEVGKTL